MASKMQARRALITNKQGALLNIYINHELSALTRNALVLSPLTGSFNCNTESGTRTRFDVSAFIQFMYYA